MFGLRKRVKFLEKRLEEIHKDYQEKLGELATMYAEDYCKVDLKCKELEGVIEEHRKSLETAELERISLGGRLVACEKGQSAMSDLFTNQITERMNSLENGVKHNINSIYRQIDRLSNKETSDNRVTFDITVIESKREELAKKYRPEDLDRMVCKEFLGLLGMGGEYIIETEDYTFVTRGPSLIDIKHSPMYKYIEETLELEIQKVSYCRKKTELWKMILNGCLIIDKNNKIYKLHD